MRTLEFRTSHLDHWSRVVVTKDVARVLHNEYMQYGWEVRVYEYYSPL
ncbi:hypothetical protein [Vibrio maerlii]|nr:hypothetical protein [Vibrio maerlii]